MKDGIDHLMHIRYNALSFWLSFHAIPRIKILKCETHLSYAFDLQPPRPHRDKKQLCLSQGGGNLLSLRAMNGGPSDDIIGEFTGVVPGILGTGLR